MVFVDEATQLSERAFRYLTTVIRGVNEFPKRFYLTCNPGGIGHRWVKRLFIDRQYEVHPEDPERTENPEDYTFISATVDDNPWLLASSPYYVRQLANMPEEMRRAHRYGDWDALGGNYFKGFDGRHLFQRFKIPEHWPIYRSFDYGLDRFSIVWWAVDEDGRSWAFRHYEAKDLVIEQAAAQAAAHTLPGEKILATYAPPDMWNRMKDTGKAMAELFFQYGLPIVRASNNRVQGHMVMKDMMQPIPLRDSFVKTLFPEGGVPEKLPGLMFFEDLTEVISDIRDIQADDKNPNDCAKEPHDVTHAVDACVTADTLIMTDHGAVPISEITEAGKCYAWDGEKTVLCEHTPAFMTRKAADVYEIELDTGEKIKATAEHRVLTAAGWKRMDELSEGDDVLTAELPGGAV